MVEKLMIDMSTLDETNGGFHWLTQKLPSDHPFRAPLPGPATVDAATMAELEAYPPKPGTGKGGKGKPKPGGKPKP